MAQKPSSLLSSDADKGDTRPLPLTLVRAVILLARIAIWLDFGRAEEGQRDGLTDAGLDDAGQMEGGFQTEAASNTSSDTTELCCSDIPAVSAADMRVKLSSPLSESTRKESIQSELSDESTLSPVMVPNTLQPEIANKSI